MSEMNFFHHRIINEARQWCRGRNAWVRAPLLVFFLYILMRHLTDPDYMSLLYPLNLGIHELGHMLFAYFGQFISTLGGTFWECAAPWIGMWNFYRQKDFFAITFCFGWLSTALFSAARYVGDARSMAIPLVSPFGGGPDGIGHDWNYLLGRLWLLAADQVLGGLLRSLAVVSMLIALGGGGWILTQMVRFPPED